MKKQDNPLLELRKDIKLPNGYYRAGQRLSKQEWEKLYPGTFINYGNCSEWFINLSEEQKKPVGRYPNVIVNQVFEEMELRSISYNQAAVEACSRYEKHLEAQSIAFAYWVRNGLTNLEYASKSMKQHYLDFLKLQKI
jgi:hypothetical protein